MGNKISIMAQATVVIAFAWGILRFLSRAMIQKLNQILLEVKPNGGNSLKDQITKIQTNQTAVMKEQKSIVEILDVQNEKLDALEKCNQKQTETLDRIERRGGRDHPHGRVRM